MLSLVNKAPVYYYPNFLSNDEANFLFIELDSIDSTKHTHNDRLLARKTLVFGTDINQLAPKIWGDNVKIMPFLKFDKIDLVLNKVNLFLNQDYNVCLVNIYDTGKDFIGWHADNEEKGSTLSIASVSLGATRPFKFLLKSEEPEKKTVDLENGSLLVMNHPCQDLYLHCLPKIKKIKEKRINLTFRKFHYNKN